MTRDPGLNGADVEGWRYQALLEIADLIGLHTDLESMLRDIAACIQEVVEFDALGLVAPP